MFTLQSRRKIKPVPATTLGKAAHKQGKGRRAAESLGRKWSLAGGLRERSRPRRAGLSRNDLNSKICSLEKTLKGSEKKVKSRNGQMAFVYTG